jgi:hypothetical protein
MSGSPNLGVFFEINDAKSIVMTLNKSGGSIEPSRSSIT